MGGASTAMVHFVLLAAVEINEYIIGTLKKVSNISPISHSFLDILILEGLFW